MELLGSLRPPGGAACPQEAARLGTQGQAGSPTAPCTAVHIPAGLSLEAPVPWERRGHWIRDREHSFGLEMGRLCTLSPGSHPGSPGHW